MARRHDRSGCGCGLLILGFPLFAPFVGVLVATVGLVGAGPAIVTYLLVTDPARLRQYPSWWIAVAAAPVLALVLVRLASFGKIHRPIRIHLRRGGVLLACTTVAALLVLLTREQPTSPDAAGQLAMTAAGAATAVTLVVLGVIRLLDRKVPSKPGRVPRSVCGATRVAPQPGEIWWGDVTFREGNDSKDRPFLVLNVHDRHADILQITSQDKSHRRDHVPFRPESTNLDFGDGWLEMRLREISLFDIRRREQTPCPPEIWRLVEAQFGSRAAS